MVTAKLNSDGHQFHQYQKEHLPLILTDWTQSKDHGMWCRKSK